MRDDKITLKLEAGKVAASDFKRAVNSFLDVIHEVADAAAGKHNAVSWLVSVEAGSTCLIAEPTPVTPSDLQTVPIVMAAVKDGFEHIAREPGIPRYFSESSMRKASDLALLVGKGAERQSVSLRFGDEAPLEFSETMADNVAKVFEIHAKSLGSIEGRLEMLSIRKGFKCHIYDVLTDRRINCTYDSEMFEAIRDALGERVSAYGIISYADEGRPMSLKLQNLRVLARDNLPGWSDVRGILEG